MSSREELLSIHFVEDASKQKPYRAATSASSNAQRCHIFDRTGTRPRMAFCHLRYFNAFCKGCTHNNKDANNANKDKEIQLVNTDRKRLGMKCSFYAWL